MQNRNKAGLRVMEVLAAWKSILAGNAPMLSIEVTRECPLKCPGCYAYGDMHLGGSTKLRNLNDYRGDDLVNGILRLVQIHRPLHLSSRRRRATYALSGTEPSFARTQRYESSHHGGHKRSDSNSSRMDEHASSTSDSFCRRSAGTS
jgi:hypothetical protein